MTHTTDHDCPGTGGPEHDCALGTDRRSFLRDGLLAVAALTAVAGPAVPLHAFTLESVVGLLGVGGEELTYPIPAADGATIDKANRLILVRYQGMVHAFSLECPHKGTMLTWEPQNSRFYCPKHKSTFKPEGTRIQGKAPRSLDRYAVRIADGKVLVDKGIEFDSKKDAAGWAAAGAKIA
jgi:nitrite reductase/ring-hydroxylating ferredoxin subunit